jgi:hypothetical protein
MRAIVIHESMYGNTRRIAESIADGFGRAECSVLPVSRLEQSSLDGCDLVIVGGPTHVFGMSRASTRHSAVVAAAEPGSRLNAEPDAEGPGLREVLITIDGTGHLAAAFDTRVRTKLSGRASRKLDRLLRRRHFDVVVPPQDFFVTKANELEPHECARARRWGQELRGRLS